MKNFTSVIAVVVLFGSQVAAQPSNDDCWNPIQVTCDRSYQGDTTNAVQGGDSYRTCQRAGTDENGVWYKFSTGSDTFEVTFDTCSPGTNFDTRLDLYKGKCTELDQSGLECLDRNDDTAACVLRSSIGPKSASADTDYLIYVHGADASTGIFDLTVRCESLAPIDPWFIQRSAYPPPDVTNVNPLEGGTWLEIHPDRVRGLTDIPELTAKLYSIDPNNPNQACDEGDLIPGVTFTASACNPVDPTCPQRQNPASLAVQQTFSIPNPYTTVSGAIWYPPTVGVNDGQFRFCVHTLLEIDYKNGDGIPDEVSYFDTYYVVEVDYTVDFLVNVATFDRNPGYVETLFDDFEVNSYLCEDGNSGTLNDALTNSEYLLGENFRICIEPTAAFPNAVIVKFNDVTCKNSAESRDVIVGGSVPNEESPLTTIDASDVKILAFESTVTSGYYDDDPVPGSFDCEGSVEMAPARRLLQELDDEEIITGSFQINITIVQEDRLSTGAIVGITIAAFVIFLLFVLLVYRLGFYDKSKKPPKTITLEESSESEGSDIEKKDGI